METLRDLRVQSCLSIAEVLESVRKIAPEIAPKERSGIINWEVQGIQNARVLSALACVYGRPIEEVIAAAQRSRASRKTSGQKLLKSAISA